MNENIVFDSMLEVIRGNSWGGACYASTAIMHTLLKLVDIESTPCIGVVKCINGDIFDHGWLEVSGEIYDIAIAYPNGTSKSHVSSYIGFGGFRGVTETPNFEYGIDIELSAEARYVSENFSNIMNHSPFWAENISYWKITELIAKFHGIDVVKDDLAKNVILSKWHLRQV